MQLKTILTELESGAISAEQAEEAILNRIEEVKARIEHYLNNSPYGGDSDSKKFAEIGWKGGLQIALVNIERLDFGYELVPSKKEERV